VKLSEALKDSAVGLIPVHWDARPLGAHARFRTGPFGSALHKADYTTDGIPVINPMHIIDGALVPTATMTVTENAARALTDFRLQVNDVIIGRRGDMGRCAVVSNREAGWLCGTGSMIVRCGKELNPAFLQRVLSSPRAIADIESSSVGSTMINLNQGTLSGLPVQVPPLAEQDAIAAALSDVDALLGAIDRLLAKKRDLKQAAMQQLLTGQTRLPGFSGKWETKRLGELLTVRHGKSQSQVVSNDGAYPVLATGGEIGRATRFLHDKPSVLIGRKGTIDRPQYMDTPFWTVDTLFYSIVHEPNDAKFLFYRFCLIEWGRYNEASGVPSLSARTIEAVTIDSPSGPEQIAIASLLSDMDTELAALEQRRDKTRLLKQGMMQELLTGRTRLV